MKNCTDKVAWNRNAGAALGLVVPAPVFVMCGNSLKYARARLHCVSSFSYGNSMFSKHCRKPKTFLSFSNLFYSFSSSANKAPHTQADASCRAIAKYTIRPFGVKTKSIFHLSPAFDLPKLESGKNRLQMLVNCITKTSLSSILHFDFDIYESHMRLKN